jgi:hypothetical protein
MCSGQVRALHTLGGSLAPKADSASAGFVRHIPTLPKKPTVCWAPAQQLKNKKTNQIWRKVHEKVFAFDVNIRIV